MSDNPDAAVRAAQEQRQQQLDAVRGEHDKRIAAHREAMAEIEKRAAASPPTPTQEEADLARLGLIGPDGFASSKEAPPEAEQRRLASSPGPRATTTPSAPSPPPRGEPPARSRD
jgi:hypothetical protein